MFKIYIRSADRSSGTAADCQIPLRLTIGKSVLSGTWQVVAELCGLIYHAGGARRLVLVSDTFRNVNSGGASLAHLSASYRVEEENHNGIRLTTKPICRNHIGHPSTHSPDNLGVVHLAERD